VFNVLSDAFPCLEIRLSLKRDPGHYIMVIAFPSIVIVALSWSSFFVPVNLPTAKLSIALLMSLSSLVMNILSRAVLAPELQGASYVTVMDVLTGSCLLFVLCALITQLIVVSRYLYQQQSQVHNTATAVEFYLNVCSISMR